MPLENYAEDVEYITPSQAARRLDLSKSRILQLNNEGRLRAIRTPLGRLFDLEDIERFAREREVKK